MELLQAIAEHSLLESVPTIIKYGLLVYLVFKIIDFATGLLKTWKGVVNYKSSVMRDGLIRWITELLAITFVIVLDLFLGLNYYLTGLTIGLFIYKEGGSIAENFTKLGVNMPGIVDDTLEKLKPNDKKGDNK